MKIYPHCWKEQFETSKMTKFERRERVATRASDKF